MIRQYILLNNVINKYRVYLKVEQMKCTSVLLHLYHRGIQKHALMNTKSTRLHVKNCCLPKITTQNVTQTPKESIKMIRKENVTL